MTSLRSALALAIIAWLICAQSSTALGDADQPHSLFLMNRDGANVRHVVHVKDRQSASSPRWSHDGRRLVFDGIRTNAKENHFFVVDADGAGLAEAGPGGAADWSPDDKQFAFATGQNPSLKTGIWVQNNDGRGRQWLSQGAAPRWSPDGSQVALDSDGLKILDLALGEHKSVFEPAGKFVPVGFDWSPEGSQLAVVVQREDKSRAVMIVAANDASTASRVLLEAQCADVAWSPDGATLAVSILNSELGQHRVHLLEIEGGKPPVEIPGQVGDNRGADWSPDGSQLAFVSTRTDIPWKHLAAPGGGVALEQVANFDSGGTCYSLSLAPDGRTALLGANMGNRHVQVWDLQTREVLHRFDMLGIFVAISPNGKEAACNELFRSSITYFNLADGSVIRDFDVGAMVMFLNISGDGSRLVCGSQNGRALVFDVKTGAEVSRLEHGGPVGTGALSPDGRVVATAVDNKLYLWDATNGRKLMELEHPAVVWSVAFSPDGSRVVTGTGGTPIGLVSEQRVPVGDDNSVRIWDVADGRLVRELKGHEHVIPAVAFSPDGRLLASGSADGTVRLWDADSGEQLASASGKSWIFKLVFSYDGSLLLTSGGNYRESPDARRITDVPEERVRVYRVVKQGDAASGRATSTENEEAVSQ